jgi:hypothetical protein
MDLLKGTDCKNVSSETFVHCEKVPKLQTRLLMWTNFKQMPLHMLPTLVECSKSKDSVKVPNSNWIEIYRAMSLLVVL